EAPAGWVQVRDAMHQLHPSAGQRDRMRERQIRERLAETAGQVSVAQGVQLRARVASDAYVREILPVRRALAGHRLQVERGPHDALAGGERLAGEESGAAFRHGEQRRAVHRRFEAEAEQPGLALAEESVDADVVADNFARPRQAAVEADPGVEQAVHRTAARLEIDAEETRE